jgi:hypothetical protein
MRKRNVMILTITFLSLVMLNSVNFAKGETASNWYNYDDSTDEAGVYIYYDGPSDYQSLAITYNLPEEMIIRGIEYYYATDLSTGFYDLDIEMAGLYESVYLSDAAPGVSVDTWRTLYNIGPAYLICEEPEIILTSDDGYADCINIRADTPNSGHSYFDLDAAGWTLDGTYDYMVDLIAEEITWLVSDFQESGTFTTSDNLDCYQMWLEAGITYNITMNIAGGNDFDMRLYVGYDEVIDDTNEVITADGEDSIEWISITPDSDASYKLLVYAYTAFTDTGDYTLLMTDNAPDDEEEEEEEEEEGGIPGFSWMTLIPISALASIYYLRKQHNKI